MPKAARKKASDRKRQDALRILAVLGLPREQQNERSALTLLALLGLKPSDRWSSAGAPLIGVTPIMNFIREFYGKAYAPNTRETIRRFTLHQFVQAGLVLYNPDDPERPTNSPKNVYQIEPNALALIRSFGTRRWRENLEGHLTQMEALAVAYAQERDLKRIPVKIAPGMHIALSPGGQSVLVEKIITEFCPRFTAGARLAYVGDTAEKWAYMDPDLFAELGLVLQEHGKMPDVVVYYESREWLVLVEAVTSHGPMNPKRVVELRELFKTCTVGLVLVTAFLDRRTFAKYTSEIAWETEVWVAETPSHMIHFNGEKFLGPY